MCVKMSRSTKSDLVAQLQCNKTKTFAITHDVLNAVLSITYARY